jgi:hypothetical protein
VEYFKGLKLARSKWDAVYGSFGGPQAHPDVRVNEREMDGEDGFGLHFLYIL